MDSRAFCLQLLKSHCFIAAGWLCQVVLNSHCYPVCRFQSHDLQKVLTSSLSALFNLLIDGKKENLILLISSWLQCLPGGENFCSVLLQINMNGYVVSLAIPLNDYTTKCNL